MRNTKYNLQEYTFGGFYQKYLVGGVQVSCLRVAKVLLMDICGKKYFSVSQLLI